VEWRTYLDIGLALLAGYLAVQNYHMSQRKDIQRESQEMTEIRVQYKQVMDILHDLQRDIRTYTTDFKALSEKVAILEEKMKTAFVRIDELKARKQHE
jgi:hypothetical protein